MSLTTVTTDDGSLTYLHPLHGASYRSLRGAATEARWVFVEGSGILHKPSPWKVLELGFGSGLSCALTVEAAIQAQVALEYVSLEPDPLPPESWLIESCWRRLDWGVPLVQGGRQLTVHKKRWQEWSPQKSTFDALYFDPFGPAVAPDCWGADCFVWARDSLNDSGVLVTYGASSAARKAMRQAGLVVGIRPGAPGKREMTVAARTSQALGEARLWKSPP